MDKIHLFCTKICLTKWGPDYNFLLCTSCVTFRASTILGHGDNWTQSNKKGSHNNWVVVDECESELQNFGQKMGNCAMFYEVSWHSVSAYIANLVSERLNLNWRRNGLVDTFRFLCIHCINERLVHHALSTKLLRQVGHWLMLTVEALLVL